jgi:hypothetical protein
LIGVFIAIHGIERLAGLRPRRILPVCIDVDGDACASRSNIAQALFHHIVRWSHPKMTGARAAATAARTWRSALRNALKTSVERRPPALDGPKRRGFRPRRPFRRRSRRFTTIPIGHSANQADCNRRYRTAPERLR